MVVAGATFPQLTNLLGKSLVHAQKNGRYRIHELLRQYAAETLTKEVERFVRARHADYYLQLLHEGLREAFGEFDIYDVELALRPRSEEVLSRLLQENDNHHTAWRWHLQQASKEIVAQHLEGLWLLLLHERRWPAIVALIDAALERYPHNPGELSPHILWHYQRGLAIWSAGDFNLARGDFEAVFSLLGEPHPLSKGQMLRAMLREARRLLGWGRRQHPPHIARLLLKANFHLVRLYALHEARSTDIAYRVLVGINTAHSETKESSALAITLSLKFIIQRKLGFSSQKTQAEALAWIWARIPPSSIPPISPWSVSGIGAFASSHRDSYTK